MTLSERADLPETFRKWADSQGYGPVQAVTWYSPDDVALHYEGAVKRLVKKGRHGKQRPFDSAH